MDQPVDNPLLKCGVDELIAKSIELRNYIDEQTQKLSDFLKPYNESREAIANEIGRRLIEQGVNTFTVNGIGTAYRETRQQFQCADKVAFLDFCLENWDAHGEMLQIGAPKVDGVKAYMDAHNGQLPPTITANPVTNIIVRRSK